MPINRIPKLRGVGLPGAFDPRMLEGIVEGQIPSWDATNERWVAGPTIITGAGDPEGAVTAAVGALFLRSDGGAATTLYVKETGTGNTGWDAK